ncbi:MAG: LCP family protein [Thermoleophilaceae bacterium]|nr:LCP family protein [Thermoleophilaceae bacterium]
MLENYERPKGIWKRLLFGTVLVMVAAATATSAAIFHEVDEFSAAFGTGPRFDAETEDALAEAERGDAQTIMVIGSDRRAKNSNDVRQGVTGGARSDTIILIRLDPKRKNTALLSLPRDLRVEIPGQGVDKLNAAFAAGGAKLALKTVKRFTGLQINHLVNIDFGGFREVVSEVGCVYADIDRRYFNDNSQGGERYATIDVKPGYQKMCGNSALDYVRYRHEDNDLVRSARQQDFLRQAKQQIPPEELFKRRRSLAKVFGDHTQSDIRDRAEVLELLKLALASARQPFKEVHFRGKIGKSYVTSSSNSVEKMTDEFLKAQSTKGPRGSLKPRGKRNRKKQKANTGLENSASQGREQGAKAVGAGARFPVFYPRMRTKLSLFAGDPRVYSLRAPNNRVYQAYRMVLKRGLVGEYYGIQGTTWKNPPILNTPSTKRRAAGRKFEIHYDGDRVRLIAWRTPKAVYWLSNTLLQSLSERQMFDIAKSARSYTG